MNNRFKNIVNVIGSPKIFVYNVIWLMFLVVIGTLAQREQGLFIAQQKYFSSWFTWLGMLPIPSGRLIMMIMLVNLSCYFFRPHIFTKNKLGITIVHSGVILLLLGGGLTAIFSSEGNMVIQEGTTVNFVEDYYLKEFAVVNTSNDDFDEFVVFDAPLLYGGEVLKESSIPFIIKVLEFYDNCDPLPRLYRGDESLKGMAKNFYLERKKNEKEFEQNISGIVYEIFDSNSENDGIYIGYLGQPVSQTININDTEYFLFLRRHRTYLPFKINLVDFKKVLHPGTNIAKSYSSDIFLIDTDITRRVLIQMNEPLRHRGYTFYQASFVENENSDTSVLAAVKNHGRLFPYISTIIMCLGLLFHIFVILSKRFKT